MSAYQGTLSTIRAAVQAKLRLEDGTDDDKADGWINLAYQQAVQETGCLRTTASADLTEGSDDYEMPTPVALIKELTINYPDGTTSDPLEQVTGDEILQRRRMSVAQGQEMPRPVYAMSGQNLLRLWPTPGAGQSLTFDYVYLPEQLVEDDDEPAIMEPFGSKLLEYGALVEGARFKKDGLLGDYEASYQSWLARFQVWLNQREGTSPTRFRVRGVRRPLVFADRSADIP